MQDLYLKFTDEAEAQAALFTDERPNFVAIDLIGTIYKPTGNMLQSEEGEVPEMAPLDGYHVNVRLVDEDGSALEPYRIYPDNPVRGWA